jgi:hypothetical protein
MKKVVIFIFCAALVTLLMSFQNCGPGTSPTAMQPPTGQASPPTANLKVEKISDLSSIESFYLVNSQMMTEDFTISSLEVDLTSGSMIEVESESLEPVGPHPAKHQLSATDLSTLQGLLQDASLCRIQRPIPPDMMCTQAIIPGYATIISAGQRYDLGLYGDGCKTSTVQLCDDAKSEQLKQLSELIFENLSAI